MHSRTNFNRDFPNTPRVLSNRSVVETLKATLLDLATPADVVLDLHCDDEGPVYLYATQDMLDAARVLSAALNAFAILTSKPGEGSHFDVAVYSRRAQAGRSPKTGLAATVELRGVLDVSEAHAENDADGLFRYLAAIGGVEGVEIDSPPNNPYVLDEALAELIPTPAAGAVLYDAEVGDRVSRGQRVARILGAAGLAHYEILAPFDGVVITRRERRFLRRGEDVLKILQLSCCRSSTAAIAASGPLRAGSGLCRCVVSAARIVSRRPAAPRAHLLADAQAQAEGRRPRAFRWF